MNEFEKSLVFESLVELVADMSTKDIVHMMTEKWTEADWKEALDAIKAEIAAQS